MKEKDLLSRLSSIEKEVAGRRVELAAIQKEVRHSASVIRSLQKEKATFERSLRAVEEKLMERLVALYKYARRGYMKILATATGLDQFRLRVKYLKAVMQEDRRALEVLVAKKEEQEKRIALLREQLSLIQSTRDQAKKRLTALKKELEDKVILLMKTHKEKEFYQTAIKELEAGAENLKNTLLDLEKRPGTYSENSGASTFIEEKGRLPLPLEGRILQGKQVLGVSAGRIRRGVYIESKSDREVRCIFPGRVAFSGRLKGYGEMVIVNHGSRFFTIFAELNQRMKKNGERVDSGDVIGVVGSQNSGGLKRLYFEIRHGEAILNTVKWLKTR
ncbi:MAG: peptidoglycan DD-metalloendopeptidase family protein [Deltaproteobacteria bacterium]|nr:peptidoglycan DD-metalloendopeptidase family protein [Deltaproteobacteria bacterium]